MITESETMTVSMTAGAPPPPPPPKTTLSRAELIRQAAAVDKAEAEREGPLLKAHEETQRKLAEHPFTKLVEAEKQARRLMENFRRSKGNASNELRRQIDRACPTQLGKLLEAIEREVFETNERYQLSMTKRVPEGTRDSLFRRLNELKAARDECKRIASNEAVWEPLAAELSEKTRLTYFRWEEK